MEPARTLEQPHARTFPPELVRCVDSFAAAPGLSARRTALLNLVEWARRTPPTGDRSHLKLFVEYLESDGDVLRRFRASFGRLLKELRCLSLFAEAGIPSDHSLSSEIAQRVTRALVPSARDESDAAGLLVTLFYSPQEARRFLAWPEDLFRRMAAIVTPHDEPDFWARQRTEIRDALRLLAARVSGLGLRPEMRDRGSTRNISESPFYDLVGSTEQLITSVDTNGAGEAESRWQKMVGLCRWEMKQVTSHMEEAGVSVELVFDLRKIEACLTRMEALANVITVEEPSQQVAAVRQLTERLTQGRLADRSLRALLHDNLNLIARKMVERTGHSGEHYIARNRSEYWQMWAAAAGGGLLTVLTAAIKMRIIDAHLPPFAEGFLSGTNYAVSFILLQVFGLVLATKQPAATAATFAGIIRDNKGRERSSKLADFVAHITSTQLAAAIGNVAAVSVGAVIFDRLWRYLFSQAYLDTTSATHVYETLNPWASGTAFYAVVTGVILWAAALAGGWCENFAVYYRFAAAVAQHPLRTQLGEERFRKVASVLEHNLGGWSTSIVLGYMLGFAPEVGKFFGLPLDIRHVTLSTGTLALAAAHYGAYSLGREWFYVAVAGIAVIFVLNLFVSFSIAAYVGLRAYDVSTAEQWQILRFLIVEGFKSPLKFILPAKANGSPSHEH